MSTISKYFKVLNENVKSNLTETSDSPYKNVLNVIKPIDLNSSNESNDFKTPKPLPKTKPKALPKKKTKPVAKRCLHKKTSITESTDYGLEHLHMAIALSKSLQNGDEEETNEGLDNGIATSASLMDIFQQYKFKSGTSSRTTSSNHRTYLEKRRNRALHITPVLLLRTQEDREQMISNKISLILSKNADLKYNNIIHTNEKVVLSKHLQNYFSIEPKTFNKSKYTLELNDFYVYRLNIDRCSVKCGASLKNWHEIPGRCASPIVVEIPSTSTLHKDRSMSPDLFDSDDEKQTFSSPILKSSLLNDCVSAKIANPFCFKSSTDQLETSMSDEFVENDKGICVFESFSEPNVCIDLSDDEKTDLEVNMQKSLSTGVSETFDKIVSLANNDDTIDYVYKLLEEQSKEQVESNNFRNVVKFGDEELYSKEINLCALSVHSSVSSNSDVFKIDNALDDSIRPQINFSAGKSESFTSTNSEESIIISDDEINYSCSHSTPSLAQKKRTLSKKGSFYSLSEDSNSAPEDDFNEQVVISNSFNQLDSQQLIHTHSNHEYNHSLSKNPEVNPSTPKTAVTVKSVNITPMANYADMDTPKIVNELEKFGLKPLKKQKGVKLLKYIYETTHPFVNNQKPNYENINAKRRKIEKDDVDPNAVLTSTVIKTGKNILGPNEPLIFEHKQLKRVASCIVPLHIAWYNLVSSDPDIQRKILLYEPLQLEDLSRQLKSQGYKYHLRDLLTFLDRKCITIRTDQTTRSRPKQHKKSRTQLKFDQC